MDRTRCTKPAEIPQDDVGGVSAYAEPLTVRPDWKRTEISLSDRQSKVPITIPTGVLSVTKRIGWAKCQPVGATPAQRDVAYPITPQQYYDLFRRTDPLDGERRLLLAVLEDAIRCYTLPACGTRRADQRALQEVKEWVNIRGDRDLFSFDSICRALDLDPEHLRRRP